MLVRSTPSKQSSSGPGCQSWLRRVVVGDQGVAHVGCPRKRLWVGVRKILLCGVALHCVPVKWRRPHAIRCSPLRGVGERQAIARRAATRSGERTVEADAGAPLVGLRASDGRPSEVRHCMNSQRGGWARVPSLLVVKDSQTASSCPSALKKKRGWAGMNAKSILVCCGGSRTRRCLVCCCLMCVCCLGMAWSSTRKNSGSDTRSRKVVGAASRPTAASDNEERWAYLAADALVGCCAPVFGGGRSLPGHRCPTTRTHTLRQALLFTEAQGA